MKRLEVSGAVRHLCGSFGVKGFKGRHFRTVEEIQCAVTRELNISKTAFLEGTKKLKGTCKQMY